MTEQNAALVVTQEAGNYAIMPAMNVKAALQRYQDQKEFIESALRINVDFGPIPGTKKNTLLKPGAEKLAFFFGLRPTFEDVASVEDWTGREHDGEPFFYYRSKCTLYHNGNLVASADGSCNSWEKKYRYRSAERLCPLCGKPAIKRSKFSPKNKALGVTPGWYCFDKAGGCGAEFSATDPDIVGQQLGQAKNPDVADIVNAILKMAQKRALVAAVLIGANASEWFTQDMEDFVDGAFTTEYIPPEFSSAPAADGKVEQPAPKPTAQPAESAAAPAPRPEGEKPWTNTKISKDRAMVESTSKGFGYWSMSDVDLTKVHGEIVKRIETNHLEPAAREALEIKRDIAQAILDYRKS